MKHLFMQPSQNSCHFIPLRPQYSPQHPVMKHPQSIGSSFNVRDQISRRCKITLLDSRREDSQTLPDKREDIIITYFKLLQMGDVLQIQYN
jgi:hypothetical protein